MIFTLVNFNQQVYYHCHTSGMNKLVSYHTHFVKAARGASSHLLKSSVDGWTPIISSTGVKR